MRLKQISGHDLMPDVARQRLEEAVYRTGDEAKRGVQEAFPFHLVCEDSGRLRVAVRDRSVFIAEFLEIQ